MKTKYLIIMAFIGFAFLFSTLACGEITKNEQFLREDMQSTIELYQKYNKHYKDTQQFSTPMWEKYGLLIKKGTENKDSLEFKDPFKVWSPLSEKENKYNYSVKEWRYLGTTIDGFLVENPDYPADAYSGKPFSQFNWLENQNIETSLWEILDVLEDQKDYLYWYNYYLDLIKISFEEEYPYDPKTGKGFDWHNFTPEIEEAMMKSAILVYPMAEGKRTLVSKTTKERISRSLQILMKL